MVMNAIMYVSHDPRMLKLVITKPNLAVVISRYGLLYVLHRLPAVANIMLTHECLTHECLEVAQQIMSNHDKANKQAELDVSTQDVASHASLPEAIVWQLSSLGSRSSG